MAITEINQTWAEESVEESRNGEVTLTVGYQVLADSPIQSTLAILDDLRIPRFGQFHPENPNLLVVGRRIRRIEESRSVAEAEITYSSRLDSPEKAGDDQGNSPQDDRGGISDDPFSDRPVVEWIPIETTKVAVRGRLKDNATGNFDNGFAPISNSAGVPYFDPPVEVPDAMWQVLYRRNEVSPDANILTYLCVVNEDSFTIGGVQIDPGEALMMPPRIGAVDHRGGKYFVPVTYDIRLRPEFNRIGKIVGVNFRGWEMELQDRGFHYLSSGDLVRATDDEGNETVEPVFLDGSGGLAADPEQSPPRVYKVFHERPFSIFNFK